MPVLSDEALAVLTSYEWPGNVRELENTLTRALVVARGDVIRAEHIELGPARDGADNGEVLRLAEVERSHVERALARAGGSKTDAARLLGVSRPRLDRLLKKYELQ